MAISDEGDESHVSKPNYFGKEYISAKADLEVFLKLQKPLTTVLTHPKALTAECQKNTSVTTASRAIKRAGIAELHAQLKS